jgi:hypothetical protein
MKPALGAFPLPDPKDGVSYGGGRSAAKFFGREEIEKRRIVMTKMYEFVLWLLPAGE